MQQDSKKIYYMEDSRKDKGIEKDLIAELLELGKKYNIHEILPLDTADICIAPWVRLKCKFGCNKYGKSWCCPPETTTFDYFQVFFKK